jgi:hypothetical protein
VSIVKTYSHIAKAKLRKALGRLYSVVTNLDPNAELPFLLRTIYM